jgi:hypothetical protein
MFSKKGKTKSEADGLNGSGTFGSSTFSNGPMSRGTSIREMASSVERPSDTEIEADFEVLLVFINERCVLCFK